MPRGGPSGRVRHDERGVAVWDWAVATGEFGTLSTTVALKKLEVADLKIEDHKPPELKLEVSGRDKAGGFDPYNQRGSGKRQGEAAQRAGITGSRGSRLGPRSAHGQEEVNRPRGGSPSHFASSSFFLTSVMRSAAHRLCSMEFE